VADVLVEGYSRTFTKSGGDPDLAGPKQLTGRSMTDHIVVFDGNERLIGRTVRVKVEGASSFTLFGTIETGEQVGVTGDGGVASAGPVGRIGLPVV
jgi:tRNA-2-methylthio-N6-dimethylallyladenosine synthase